MTITESNHLERVVLAFRGDTDGSFKGAHAERFSVVSRDGVALVRQPGKATTISELAATGFQWPDVVSGINTGMLLTHEAQLAQIAELTAERDAAIQERTEAQIALSAVQAQLDALKASLVPVIDGVPQVVSRFQARAALHGAGLLQGIEQLMSAPDIDPLMRLAWSDAQNFERQSPTLLALASALKLTAEQVDALFVQAAQIKA